MSEDGNGNILFVKADSSGKEHNIMWQVSSRTNQRNKGQIERIIDESKDIKEKIIGKLIGNIKNQNRRNTIVEIASALDLAWKCDKATHI